MGCLNGTFILGAFMMNDCPKNTKSVDQQWRSIMQIQIFPLVVEKQHKILPNTISLYWIEILLLFFDTLNSHFITFFCIMTFGNLWT